MEKAIIANQLYHLLCPQRRSCFQSGWFDCLSAGLRNNYWPSFHVTLWKGVAWARTEPIKFWSRSKSQGGYTNNFSLSQKEYDSVLGWTPLPSSIERRRLCDLDSERRGGAALVTRNQWIWERKLIFLINGINNKQTNTFSQPCRKVPQCWILCGFRGREMKPVM